MPSIRIPQTASEGFASDGEARIGGLGAASVDPGSLRFTSDLVDLDAAGEVPGIEPRR